MAVMACAWGIVRNIIVIAQADILDVKLGESIGLRICHRGRLALKCGAAMLPREPRPRDIIFAAAEVQRVAKEASVRAQLVYCNIRVAALVNGGEKVIEQRRIRHINAAINFCAFCAIPYIRGRYRSRPIENIIDEATELAQHGVKELIVIAQDITRYGTDIYGKRSLARLCRELAKIDGVEWIRLHYLYPDQFDDELIDELASNDKVVKYLDIPIQHINNSILKRMNRRGTGDEIRELFKTLRERIPGLVLRTSLIAGLPGEGEAEFEELCEFLREARIERVGVFPFSPEEGTPAAKMEHVDEDEARRRADLIMQLQAPIMDDFCQSFVGKTIRVLCVGYDEELQRCIGRSYADSPDIDGLVYFTGRCPEGEMTDVLISGADDGMLIGDEI